MKITLEKLMKMSPETLAKKQHDALKQHVIDILDNVKRCIQQEKYDDIPNFCSYSPAGDGIGLDNDYIEFSYNLNNNAANHINNRYDILEISKELKRLAKMIEEGQK